jgi:hypothetical protein
MHHGDLVNPLELLREQASSSREVTQEGEDVLLGGVAFQRSQPCGVDNGKGELLDLGSLCYLLACARGPLEESKNLQANYKYAECNSNGVTFVSHMLRVELVEYLLGRKDAAGLEKLELAPTPPMARIVRKRKSGDGADEGEAVLRAEPVDAAEAARARPANGDVAQLNGEDDGPPILDERPLGHRRARLRNPGARDFNQASALKFASEELKRTSRGGAAQRGPAPAVVAAEASRIPKARPTLLQSLKSTYERKFGQGKEPVPYIVVPRNSHALINLLNAKRFMQEFRYDPPSGDLFNEYDNSIEVTHTIHGKDMTFRIVDSTNKFTTSDWKMTVAVFVDGTEWQFKSWPFQTFAELFATIKGFYIQHDETLTPKFYHNAAGERYSAAAKLQSGVYDVEAYPVVRLRVKRAAATQHADMLVAYNFWRELEKFLALPRTNYFSNDATLGDGPGPRAAPQAANGIRR